MWLLSFCVASIVPSIFNIPNGICVSTLLSKGEGCLFRKHEIISERERERLQLRSMTTIYNYYLDVEYEYEIESKGDIQRNN